MSPSGSRISGSPGSYLDRQVARWRSQLESYAAVESYPGPGVDVEHLGAWLEAHRPGTEHVGILHGDFHLGNVIFAPDGSLAAIVDWELATIGDPLLDFAQLLVTWPDPGSGMSLVGSMPPALAEGLTPAADMIARYGAGTDWDLSDLAWYRVLAGYRLGIILEGTRVRAGAGQAPPEIGDMLHQTAVNLWEQARRTILSV